MNKGNKLYEGKAKIIYETKDKDLVIQHFKDDATAFNNLKKAKVEGKGVLNNRISEYILSNLSQISIFIIQLLIYLMLTNVFCFSSPKPVAITVTEILLPNSRSSPTPIIMLALLPVSFCIYSLISPISSIVISSAPEIINNNTFLLPSILLDKNFIILPAAPLPESHTILIFFFCFLFFTNLEIYLL